jgi:protein phosphatase
MTLTWRYAVASDVGLLREGNEDAAFAGRRLLAVADGMGGHAAGEVASAAVIAALEQLDELGVNAGDPEEALNEAITEANAHLRDMVAADNELHGMGTTVTALLMDGDQAWLVHVGDSRAYLLRDGALRQITRDHTFVQQLVDEGRIAPEDASTHPQRNYITRALDGREGIEADVQRLDVRPGDRLLVCSDGLSGVVSDESLAEVLTGSTPDEAVQRLVDLALRGGAPDNVTCIVADPVEEDAAPRAGTVVAGAAGAKGPNATVAPSARRDGSPASRAATLPRQRRTPEPPRDADGPDPRGRARSLRRRRALVLALVTVTLLAVGATTGWAWTQRQYYVGVDGDRVAIYQGVEGSLAGVELSHVDRRLDLPVDDLPDFQRKRVRDGIHVGGLAEAQRVVDQLTEAATPVCPPAKPTPTATPKPTPKTTPKTSPKAGATPRPTRTPSARPTRTPSPSPVPTPTATPTCRPATAGPVVS